ncbi:CRISPR-associated protein Cse1 [Candidatus Palauibacter sp.]|uniref:CRISPR-associated protein Cse1 n=1 Tax=Candidatus Palauibacter sp. TaxID=3101350 RepID=UPI003B51D1EF
MNVGSRTTDVENHRKSSSRKASMHNLLAEQLIRFRSVDGLVEVESLPGVYAAMVADRVESFPALRPHQRHAWHAFLAQLAVLALVRAQRHEPPQLEGEWRQLLRALTPAFRDDAPWCLVVQDPSRPAFMQCPATSGLAEYRKSVDTPDDLDLLVTSKNHDLKSSVAAEAAVDDWLFSLVSLQTMSGYPGRGNYGVARMNGGWSSRPCLGLAPAAGGVGAHLVHDIRQMIDQRSALLELYEQYFLTESGVGLTWLEPWDGRHSLRLVDLDPYFIEICRRVRMVSHGRGFVARCASSRVRRIAAAEAKGAVGDHWTPVKVGDETKAFSVTEAGFRYDRLAELILDQSAYLPVPAMSIGSSEGDSWRLVARGVAGGQGGKTKGYHERADIILSPRVARSLFLGGEDRLTLEELARRQLAEVKEVISALRRGIAIAASGGKDAGPVDRTDRKAAAPYALRLDSFADAHFFEALQSRFGVPEELQAGARRRFVRRLIRRAEALLGEAIRTVSSSAIHRYRAEARARSAFHWRLRGSDSVFSDQPDIFETESEEEPHET